MFLTPKLKKPRQERG